MKIMFQFVRVERGAESRRGVMMVKINFHCGWRKEELEKMQGWPF